ncbi:MAG: hypothetical protein ACRDUB_23700, partial [Mycobacterium sp.]
RTMSTYRITTVPAGGEIGILDADDPEDALDREAQLNGYRDRAAAEEATRVAWYAEPVRTFHTREPDHSLELWTDDPRIAELVGGWTADEACDADMVVDACRTLGFRGARVAAPGLWGPYVV